MKPPVHKHITPQALPGQQLPADWQKAATGAGGLFDRRDLSQLWRAPQWSSKLNGDNIDNLMRNSRLSSIAASGI